MPLHKACIRPDSEQMYTEAGNDEVCPVCYADHCQTCRLESQGDRGVLCRNAQEGVGQRRQRQAYIVVSDGEVEACVGATQPDGLLVVGTRRPLLAVKVPNVHRLAACITQTVHNMSPKLGTPLCSCPKYFSLAWGGGGGGEK